MWWCCGWQHTAAVAHNLSHGMQVSAPQPVPEHGVTVVFVELPNTKIELLHPLGDKSPISKFLERNPAGTYAPSAMVLAVHGKQPPACACAPQAASIMCAWRWLTCGRACRPSPRPACACWTRNPRSARTATRCVVAAGSTQWQGRAAQPIALLYCDAGGVPAPQGQRWRADGAGGGRAQVTRRGGDGGLYTTESLALTAGCTNVCCNSRLVGTPYI